MAPKTRTSKDKSDWRICPESGVLYHTTDAAAHATWLSAGASSLTAPPYAHVRGKQFRSQLSLAEDRTLAAPSLSESVKFVSVFLPKPVLNPCQIGFAGWVRVSSGNGNGFEAVLRAFPSNTAAVSQTAMSSNVANQAIGSQNAASQNSGSQNAVTSLMAGRYSWLGRAQAAGQLLAEDILSVETFRNVWKILFTVRRYVILNTYENRNIVLIEYGIPP
jgi:hypothetical protein